MISIIDHLLPTSAWASGVFLCREWPSVPIRDGVAECRPSAVSRLIQVNAFYFREKLQAGELSSATRKCESDLRFSIAPRNVPRVLPGTQHLYIFEHG